MILIKDYNVATEKSDIGRKKSLDEVFNNILEIEASRLKGDRKL
jgi:hypothetical protein